MPARRLLKINTGAFRLGSATTLVGRRWELGTIGSLLDEVTDGAGAVVTIAGPPGIGKTRLAREAAVTAGERGVAMFSTYCESHSGDIAFRVVTRLLRAITGVNDLDTTAARDSVRAQFPDADPQDVLLFDDLLGIADPAVPLPEIAPDARRRRLTALINTASLARTTPTLYVIEDVHWIDQASEALIADFLTVIPQTPSLVLITYRPEYHGPLSRLEDAQSMRLRPLSTSHAAALTTELLGADPSVAGLGAVISERAAGNPFFVEEIVRDLAEQGVLDGPPGARRQRHALSDVQVPATLQAAIAARIDRLDADAKRTLNAAAVIGARFDTGLLTVLAPDPAVDELVAAQLIDQTRYTPHAEYAFHHPLIQTVAYTTQLKSTRAQLHRRLADAIEHSDENAAFIAEHLESANDFADAYGWHMRAGAWSLSRDITAAHTSWARARQLADNLPTDHPNRADARIAARAQIAATAWRAGGSGAESGFEELRDLCAAAGDQRSLAMGMAGQIITLEVQNRRREASQLGAELTALLERIGDPALTVAAGVSAVVAKFWTAEMTELLRVADLVIDASGGDVTVGNLVVESPVLVVYALRGTARWCLGISGWKDDLQASVTLSHQADPATRAVVAVYTYMAAVPNGVLVPDAAALRETADTLDVLEQHGDNFSLNEVRMRQGGGPGASGRSANARRRSSCSRGCATSVVDEREPGWSRRSSISTSQRRRPAPATWTAPSRWARSALDDLYGGGGSIFCPPATTVLVQSLLARGTDSDLQEAQAAIDRLATASPTDPGMALIEVTSLRLKALLAQAHGDAARYREMRDRYRALAIELGFEGHMEWADAMA